MSRCNRIMLNDSDISVGTSAISIGTSCVNSPGSISTSAISIRTSCVNSPGSISTSDISIGTTCVNSPGSISAPWAWRGLWPRLATQQLIREITSATSSASACTTALDLQRPSQLSVYPHPTDQSSPPPNPTSARHPVNDTFPARPSQ